MKNGRGDARGAIKKEREFYKREEQRRKKLEKRMKDLERCGEELQARPISAAPKSVGASGTVATGIGQIKLGGKHDYAMAENL